MLSDLRFALRRLIKAPGFTVVAVLTLALGIGLNTSMFSLMQTILLRPVPFSSADEVVAVYRTTPSMRRAPFASATFLDLQRESRDTIQLAAFLPSSVSLAEPGQPATWLGALRVSSGFFAVAGVEPARGRIFTAEENEVGRSDVVILSHATWQQFFGGDPGIINREVRIDGEKATVVGIMPASFTEPRLWGQGSIFRPLGLTDKQANSRTEFGLWMIGRYAPGLSHHEAAVRLESLASALARDHRDEMHDDGINVMPVAEAVRTPANTMATLLLSSLAAFVLLIGCANLANLQLSRSLARSRESVLRCALGASRGRLIAPVIQECLLLAVAGGVLGVLIASWCNDWMAHAIAVQDANFRLPFNRSLTAFAFGVSVIAGLLFGVIPAWMGSRVRLNDSLKSSSRGSTGDHTQARVRSTLIAAQFALALILLAAAGLFIRGIDRFVTKPRGWNLDGVIQGTVALPDSKYPDMDAKYSFYLRVEERLAALPGAECATLTGSLPLLGLGSVRNIVIAGRDTPSESRQPVASVNEITPSYLQTTTIKLVRGRNFAATDQRNAPQVALINETMARTLFPGEDPIGQRIGLASPDQPQWLQVVGVVGDVEAISFNPPPSSFQVYRPLAQETPGSVQIAIRTRGTPSILAEPFRRVIAEMDPDLSVRNLATIDDVLERQLSGFSLVNDVLGGFACLGTFMAAMGIYGVIAHAVVRRTPEIGIRLALGAQVGQVLRLMLGSAVRVAVIGVVAGAAGAYAVGRIVVSFLPFFPAMEFALITVLAVALVIVGLIACWLPARRATRVDPVEALRAE